MKILIVDDDDSLLSFLAAELEVHGCEVLQTHFGDGGLHLYQKNGPWEFVLSDFRFIPGPTIKDGVQLLTAIHGINPFQQMAIMTSDPQGARRSLPKALRHLPVLRKPFGIEQVLRLLRQPVLPLRMELKDQSVSRDKQRNLCAACSLIISCVLFHG